MTALMMFFAAAATALQAPATAPGAAATGPQTEQPAEEPSIEVMGPVICKRVTASAETRVGQRRMCLTARQWTEVRDKAVEFYNDLPRRNPRAAGRTIPDPFDIPR